MFGGRGDGEPNGEIPPSRQAQMREEACERESALMDVLKNVVADQQTEQQQQDETDAEQQGRASAEAQPTTGRFKKHGSGFSFFGMKSKSRDHVLR